MSARVYEVVETITITGVGYARARSQAEAVEIAKRGGVEFDWDQGQIVRRGDGIKARRVPADEADFYDPTAPSPTPAHPTATRGEEGL